MSDARVHFNVGQSGLLSGGHVSHIACRGNATRMRLCELHCLERAIEERVMQINWDDIGIAMQGFFRGEG